MPWLTPIGPVGELRAYRVYLPYSIEMEADYIGAVRELEYEWNWQQYGELTPEEVAAIWQEANELNRELRPALPIATVIWRATNDTPDGFIAADGSQYNTSDYQELFNAIGYTWGGSGGVFNVPDLVGRFAVGVSGSIPLGASGGASQETLAENHIPSHNHSVHTHFEALAVAPGELPVTIPSIVPGSTGNTGGGNPHNNMPPYAALKPFISYR